MRTELKKYQNTGFEGTLIGRCAIKMRNVNNSKDVRASFVLLDPKCRDDCNAMNVIANKWEKPSFTNVIVTAFEWSGMIKRKSNMRYYIMTTQADKFEKLAPERILGIGEVEETKPHKAILHHLQIKPSAQNLYKDNSEYKHVGTQFVRGLQNVYNKIGLTSVRDDKVRNFYRFLGFRESVWVADRFSWSAGIFERIKRLFVKNIRN